MSDAINRDLTAPILTVYIFINELFVLHSQLLFFVLKKCARINISSHVPELWTSHPSICWADTTSANSTENERGYQVLGQGRMCFPDGSRCIF